MKILALLLLLIGLTKLCLVTISNKMEIKELFYNTPILVNIPPDSLKAIITADGLICTLGGIALFCL